MGHKKAPPGNEYHLSDHRADCFLQPLEDGSVAVPSWCTCKRKRIHLTHKSPGMRIASRTMAEILESFCSKLDPNSKHTAYVEQQWDGTIDVWVDTSLEPKV